MTSPPGGSTLITSAPKSARICVAYGPITTVVRSSTRTPLSGPLMPRSASRAAHTTPSCRAGRRRAMSSSRPHAAAARRAVDPERLDLGTDALGELLDQCAGCDAQAHLVRRLRVAKVAAVRTVDPDDVDADVADVVAQPLAHDLAGQARTLER